MSLFCSNCGKELDERTRFCPYCGKRLETVEEKDKEEEKSFGRCKNCGTLYTENDIMCPGCGIQLRESSFKEFSKKIYSLEKNISNLGIAHSDSLCTFISTYPIPKNKDDLDDFIFLAVSRIKYLKGIVENSSSNKKIVAAWETFLERANAVYFKLFNKNCDYIEKQETERITKEAEKNETKRKEDKQKFSMHLSISIVGAIVMVCSVFGIRSCVRNKKAEEQRVLNEHIENGDIKLPFSHNDLTGKKYTVVYDSFSTLGFTNIQCIKNSSGLFRDEEVEEVTINGSNKFKKNTWFPYDAAIMIYFHKGVF